MTMMSQAPQSTVMYSTRRQPLNPTTQYYTNRQVSTPHARVPPVYGPTTLPTYRHSPPPPYGAGTLMYGPVSPPQVPQINPLRSPEPMRTKAINTCRQCAEDLMNAPSTSKSPKTLREKFRTWKRRKRDRKCESVGSALSEFRYDSLRKIDRSDAPIEEDLKSAPWYQTGIPREIALEMLTQEEIGSFVVRDSTTHPGCYALSVKVPKFDNPSGISHYLITRTSHGAVKLKGLDKEWSSLTALVTHHSVMRELLPCTLRLPRNSNNPAFNDDDDKGEQEEDEDYQRLADFSHMMQDLKM